MKSYKPLKTQVFELDQFKIVPIRMEDRYAIMKWRNEQLYHLRQSEILTKKSQDDYFENIVSKLFDQQKPDQILFSYLKKDNCIGYGGLVHINWIDKNAEISFVMNTSLEKDFFEFHWAKFLKLLEKVAFEELNFHKIYTYAFDIRPRLYTALLDSGFSEEARLKQHCFFNDKFIDVLIHSKFRKGINFREVLLEDSKILYNWVNEKEVRDNSLDSNPIKWQDHIDWFKKKIENRNSRIFIFFKDKVPLGQVRLDFEDGYWVIDFSVDAAFRGNGYGVYILQQIINLQKFKKFKAIVKRSNIGSLKVFDKLKFEISEFKILNDEEVIEFKKEI